MTEPVRQRLRFQFSMRFALLLMAILGAVLGVAVYVTRPVNRRITIDQVSRIKLGMSERQVIAVLGAPLHRFEGAPSLRWTLDDQSMQSFAVADICFLDVAFDEKRKVVRIDEVGHSRLRTVRPAAGNSLQKPGE